MYTPRRLLSTTLRRLDVYARTSVNPVNYKLVAPSNFQAKSLILLSTPNNLNHVIEQSIDVHEQQGIQVLVAGVDTVPPNSQPNGVSELWSDSKFQIIDSVQLDERDDLHNKPKESDGVNVVSARKNWKTIKSKLKLQLNSKVSVDLNLANTVFTTGNLVTLFYFENGDPKPINSGQTLCELKVSYPEGSISTGGVSIIDKLTPLYEEKFTITDCIGNMIKSIDNKSASGFLQDSDKLMSIASKETGVYARIYPKDTDKIFKYQIIAGGGGWGAKASRIVLSPEAKLAKGDRIEFFMLTPHDKLVKPVEDLHQYDKKIIFESSHESDSYESEASEEVILENIFGCGSEDGFHLNGVYHSSTGERLIIDNETVKDSA